LFHVRFPTVGAFVSSPPYTTTTFHTTSRLHSYSNLSPWSYNGSKGREKHWSSYVKKQLDNDDRGGESFTEEELAIFPSTTEDLTSLPQHASNDSINNIIDRAQKVMEKIQIDVQHDNKDDGNGDASKGSNGEAASGIDTVYSNSYVDLGKVDTIGFDYDYTLVTYTDELLELIYDMALSRLVNGRSAYPPEMLDATMKYDPKFSIRGLAVDRETGWICHLSYTHKVAVAWEGRKKVSRSRLMREYAGKRSLEPSVRVKRLKPLNDLFSMSECCLIADTIQFFLDKGIPFCPRNVVKDVSGVIGETHISGDFHRLVAADPKRYFERNPHIGQVLKNLKNGGKRLIFVSNSPFWYVDSGMSYFFGENWRETWDAVIVSAGKPNFYTDYNRPFREVSTTNGRVKFKKIERMEPNEVYTDGCLKELTKCLGWEKPKPSWGGATEDSGADNSPAGGGPNNVLYIGDSLFADLVDAKREYGWTTAVVAPEVGWEIDLKRSSEYRNSKRSIDLILHTLRRIQSDLGCGPRNDDDLELMDKLEHLVSLWRQEQNASLGNPFGSVFRARHQPSLFASSIRRYCDLYMAGVGSLRHYSPQHRFYPSDARLLSHEMMNEGGEDLEDI